MNEYGFLEYRAKLVNSPDLEGNGELARARRGIIWIHCNAWKANTLLN